MNVVRELSSPVVPLADVLQSVRSGFANGEKTADGTIQIRMNNITKDGAFDWSDLRRVPCTSRQITEYAVKPGDVMFNQTNSRDLVGKVAFFDGRAESVVFSNHFLRIRPDHARVDGRYIALFLHGLFRKGYFRNKCVAWVNQATFGKEDLLSLEIPLPPLAEQRRIAAILDKADAIRRKHEQALALADDAIQSTFIHVIGPKASGYRTWQERAFGDLVAPGPASMRTGPFGSDLLHSEFVESGIAVLGIDNAVQNKFAWAERRYITAAKYEKLKRYTVLPGDVIVTIMGTTGRSAVVPQDIPTAITTKHLATLTLDRRKAEPEVMSNALHRHPYILRQIAKENKGAIMAGLNLGIIKALRIPLPPIEVQRQFVAELDRLRCLERQVLDAHQMAEVLFASLSQRAFRGEL